MLPNEALVYNKLLFEKIPYDPEKDFTPVTNPFFATQAIVVNRRPQGEKPPLSSPRCRRRSPRP